MKHEKGQEKEEVVKVRDEEPERQGQEEAGEAEHYLFLFHLSLSLFHTHTLSIPHPLDSPRALSVGLSHPSDHTRTECRSINILVGPKLCEPSWMS